MAERKNIGSGSESNCLTNSLTMRNLFGRNSELFPQMFPHRTATAGRLSHRKTKIVEDQHLHYCKLFALSVESSIFACNGQIIEEAANLPIGNREALSSGLYRQRTE